MAAMVEAIEQPWWADERDMSKMTGKVCRAIGKKTENMEARLRGPSDNELKQNIDEMQLLLDKLMIKRTAKSRTMMATTCSSNFHHMRQEDCLSAERVSEEDTSGCRPNYPGPGQSGASCARCEKVKSQGHEIPQATYGSYFSKAYKLRAATVIPNILDFSKRHHLKLTDDESRNERDCHGQGQQRPVFPELDGKQDNWLQHPEDSIYNAHLNELTRDAPKLVALKHLIDSLSEDIYERAEKLVIFTISQQSPQKKRREPRSKHESKMLVHLGNLDKKEQMLKLFFSQI